MYISRFCAGQLLSFDFAIISLLLVLISEHDDPSSSLAGGGGGGGVPTNSKIHMLFKKNIKWHVGDAPLTLHVAGDFLGNGVVVLCNRTSRPSRPPYLNNEKPDAIYKK